MAGIQGSCGGVIKIDAHVEANNLTVSNRDVSFVVGINGECSVGTKGRIVKVVTVEIDRDVVRVNGNSIAGQR